MQERRLKKTEVHSDFVNGNKIIANGDITGTSGVAVGRGVQTSVAYSSLASDEIVRLFVSLYARVERMAGDDEVQADVTETLQKIEAEVRKGDEADLGKIERWLRLLAGLSGDVFEATTEVLTHSVVAVNQNVRATVDKSKEALPPNQPAAQFQDLEARVNGSPAPGAEADHAADQLNQLRDELAKGEASDVRAVRSLLSQIVEARPSLRQPLWDWLSNLNRVPTPVLIIARKLLT